MVEEKKVETETTKEDSKEEESKENSDAETEEENEEENEKASDIEKSKEDNIDYQAELEKEEQFKKPDPELARQKFKEREEKRKSKEDNEDKEEEVDTNHVTRAEFESWQKQTAENEVKFIVEKYATNDDEKELIVAKWRNRTFPANMPLSQQIEESFVLANSKKIIAERNEALRALASKDKANTGTATSKSSELTDKEKKLSSSDSQVLIQSGYKYNTNTRQYEKKLGSGKILIADIKTGKTRLAK